MNFHHPDEEDIYHHISQRRLTATQSILPHAITGRFSPRIDNSSKSSSVAEHYAHHSTMEELTGLGQGRVTIDMLPEEVLLGIFDYCVCDEEWQKLIHVCRRWRCLVFGSPRRLDLRLVCSARKPVRRMLDIWPALPITVRGLHLYGGAVEDNLVAALEKNDRVYAIHVEVHSNLVFGVLAELMKDPYPALVHLDLLAFSREAVVVPDSILGGFAPNLEYLRLKTIVFPALPKLLLSATGLVHLRLLDIPPWGYIPPETIVDCLSSLTRLQGLQIQFRSSRFLPSRTGQHLSLTRTVLPMLTSLVFNGVHEYLYHLFSHIDTPILESVNIRFFNPAVFDVSQISPFIGHTETFGAFNHAHMLFRDELLLVSLSSRSGITGGKTLLFSMKCSDSVWQLQYLTQSRRLPLTNLDLDELAPPLWTDDMENPKWLELLRFLPALENLCVSEELAIWLAQALEELTEGRVMEVLPVLHNLFIEGLVPHVEKALGKFVAARQLSGHPIAVQRWPGGNVICASAGSRWIDN